MAKYKYRDKFARKWQSSVDKHFYPMIITSSFHTNYVFDTVCAKFRITHPGRRAEVRAYVEKIVKEHELEALLLGNDSKAFFTDMDFSKIEARTAVQQMQLNNARIHQHVFNVHSTVTGRFKP